DRMKGATKTCPRCFGKGLEGQDDRPGLLLDPEHGTDECRECGGTGRVPDPKGAYELRERDLDEKTAIGGYLVSTVALRVEHHGGMWYETYIFPAKDGEITDWSEVWGVRYATRNEAIEGHARTCDLLRSGQLKTWD